MKRLTNYLLIVTILLLSGAGLTEASSKRDDKKVIHEKTFKISPGKKIFIKTDTGDISVTPWNKSEVYIKVTGNENAAEKFDYEFNANSEEVKIIAEKKEGWNWFSNINLHFEIKVPENFNIDANTSGGDIRVGGIKGDISLKTSGGDIQGDRIAGNFSAKTSGGDIKIFSGDAKISAATSGGDIDLEYTGENKGIELKTSGGDIDIIIPANFNARAELRTSGGDVECNLKLNDVKKMSKTKVEADINKGGKPLIAITSGGDVKVSKK